MRLGANRLSNLSGACCIFGKSNSLTVNLLSMRHWLLLFPLLLLSALVLGQKAVPYGHNPAAGKFAAVRGLKLYYETYGAGPPLLLLHGNGGSSQAEDDEERRLHLDDFD